MEEEEQENRFIPPPTADEVAPEPKESGKISRSQQIFFVILSVAILVIGGLYIFVDSGSSSSNNLSGELLFTTTMICGGLEDNVCETRDGNVFEKGESIWVVTRIIPNTDEDVDVDMSFTTDIYAPNGEVTENFLGGHNLKKTITDGKYSEYWIEITTGQEDLSGRYDIILNLKDNLIGKEETIENQFNLE